MRAARAKAAECGIDPIPPAVGSTLRLLAGAVRARAVVEIGTGTGVSGTWLLRGMRPDGVLTTIDIEPAYQRIAKQVFQASDVAASRTRVIAGHGLQVLSRLTDGAYDLVFADADPATYIELLAESRRVLRDGGLVVMHGPWTGPRLIEPSVRDRSTIGAREVLRELRDSDQWLPAMLAAGTGLITAMKTVTT